jgi:DNA mismatch repair protein MutS2
MRLFPASALQLIEFDKIKALLVAYCNTNYAKDKSENLRVHTRIDFIAPELQQSHEYKLLMQNQLNFPSEYVFNLEREIKMLGISGAVLSGSQIMLIKGLTESIQKLFRWFNEERVIGYPGLYKVISHTYFEKKIIAIIEEVLDEKGNVMDSASEALAEIRMSLYKKRNELRRLFGRIVSKLNKSGYLADIEESFMNGRRVLAVFAEQKRMVRGIMHGESESRRTAFIEPEETIEYNNAIASLENQEEREVQRILQNLTLQLSAYSELIGTYFEIAGEYDFIRAKAKLAIDYNGNYPSITDKAVVQIQKAYHPLLFLYNKKAGKLTVPVTLSLDSGKRILVISGPNAGGKTVTLKTIGLLQLMIQSGLLVPCSPDSEFGIFKQMMVHIGDTQSIEFELSTYSSHLRSMKYFLENANGKTMFFIDELGSGSDPNLGGAFAEVILEELAKKHAMGIVTTHYLNLKVMANKVTGIINGAMAFDEKNLVPMYTLAIGKPGSSYTFAIAERIGMPSPLINKAKQLVEEEHYKLDKLLNKTEQDMQKMDIEKERLDKLLKENEQLKNKMQSFINKESHKQQVELLKQQNLISEEKLAYLKDMERRLKALVIEWKKSEDKDEVVKMIHALLFKQKDKLAVTKQQKKLDAKYEELEGDVKEGDKVKMKNSRQVGVVKELRGKKAIIQIGMIPITVNKNDLVLVKEKIQHPQSE